MSDTPMNPADRDLDERIRALVATAVGDAPPAPNLDATLVGIAEPGRPDRRPWLIAATSLLGAAAAVIAVVIVSQREDAVVTPPAGPPPVATTTLAPSPASTGPATTDTVGSSAPPPSTVPVAPAATTAMTTVALATPSPSPTPSPSATTPETAAATTPATSLAPASTTTTAAVPPAPAIGAGPAIAVAGGDVIDLLDARGVLVGTITEAADIALALGDGRVLFQTQGGAGDGLAPGDTNPFIWDDGSRRPLGLAAGDTDYIRIHDVAVVDGRHLVLYTTNGSEANPETYGAVRLWAADIDGGEATPDAVGAGAPIDLGVVGTWETGPRRLHLAADGLIVGTIDPPGEPASSWFVSALPGSPGESYAAGLTPESLGVDCTDDCPVVFTVNGAGTMLAWLDDAGVTRVPLDGDAPDAPGAPTTEPFPGTTGVGDVDLLDDGGYVVTYSEFRSPRPAALLVAADGQTVDLPGLVATWAPALGSDQPAPPATTPSSTTAPDATVATTAPASTSPATSPPPTTGTPDSAQAAPAARPPFATAGTSGVTVHDGAGDVVRALGQSAEIAILTPGGAVVFQPARTEEDGKPGDPLLWQADGSVEPLLVELPPEQSYRLHDVAEIEGVPTVLYGVHTQPADVDPAKFVEVVHALRMDPAGWVDTVIDEINTWEGGWSRLSLSGQGLVVGESYESVSKALYVNAVPDSPTAGATIDAASLGVEPEYSECANCPGHFTATSDGSNVAWMDGQAIVLHALASGEQRRISSDAVGHLIDGSTITGLDVAILADGAAVATLNLRGTTDDPELLRSFDVTISPNGAAEFVLIGEFATLGPTG